VSELLRTNGDITSGGRQDKLLTLCDMFLYQQSLVKPSEAMKCKLGSHLDMGKLMYVA
jgi:hypothetical protein